MAEHERRMRERGRRRRELLLDATIELIAERGISGVTHRAVAAAAGVPSSSTTYFFDSIDDLIGDAVATAMDRELERLSALRASMDGAAVSTRQMIDLFVDFVRDERNPHTVAQFEIYLFASRKPELQRRVTEILDATRVVARDALGAAGVTDPLAADGLLAMIDGFALHRIAHSEPRSLLALNRALRALVIGFTALESAHDLPAPEPTS
jgi:DNA-binding transcriptional regulator YbjK